MATIEKKYLSYEGLKSYDAKIKAHLETADEAVLEAAKKYTDEAPYDPAGTAQTKVEALENGAVKDNADAIAAINNEETGILKQAKDHADGLAATNAAAAEAAQNAADAAQADVDALVVNEEGNKGKITVLEEKVAALEAGTYDDTEVRGLIQTNADDIDTLEGRAEALEGQVSTLVGDDANKSVRTIANEELAKQLIAENAAESLNELQEIAAWIQSHPEDASAMNKAIEDLEALVGTLPEGVTATTIVAYIQEVVAAEKARAEGIEGGLDERLQAVEAQLGTEGDDTVDARIEAAKQAAITAATEAAAADATAKDEVLSGKIDELASTDAEKPGRVTVLEGRADALEGRAEAVEGRVTDIETSLAEGGATATAIAAAKKSGDDAQAAVDALIEGEVTALRTDVDELKSVSYVEITTEEIDALFTTAA